METNSETNFEARVFIHKHFSNYSEDQIFLFLGNKSNFTIP